MAVSKPKARGRKKATVRKTVAKKAKSGTSMKKCKYGCK